MFPRYLFVAVDPDVQAWRAIRSTIGVADLVSFGDRPATVPQEIIDEILARQDEQGLVRTMDVAGFQRGDAVQLVDGPLADLSGLFECPNDDDRVTVLLAIMGRPVRVRVSREAVSGCA